MGSVKDYEMDQYEINDDYLDSSNQNMLKLKVLAEIISKNCTVDMDYKHIVEQLKSVVDSNKDQIETNISSQQKIKCYESMCAKITAILNKVKIV